MVMNRILSLIKTGDVEITNVLGSKMAQLTPDLAVCEFCCENFDRVDADAVCEPVCRVDEWDVERAAFRYCEYDYFGPCRYCLDQIRAETCPRTEYGERKKICSMVMKHKERREDDREYRNALRGWQARAAW